MSGGPLHDSLREVSEHVSALLHVHIAYTVTGASVDRLGAQMLNEVDWRLLLPLRWCSSLNLNRTVTHVNVIHIPVDIR